MTQSLYGEMNGGEARLFEMFGVSPLARNLASLYPIYFLTQMFYQIILGKIC
jgi:hypothetical protein